jgi:hypothetical protein
MYGCLFGHLPQLPGGLEIDGLSPFSARPKCVWVGEMSLFINKNLIYFIRH